jgi:sporulation integral membrane protein YlbJ
MLLILLIIILIYVLIKEFANSLPAIKRILIMLGIMLFTISVIINPGESYKAAFDGLKTWFNIVCPSLLPFFIGSTLLVELGLVKLLGAFLEPVMRPVFNVPGCGSFPFVMSITSGYPVGAKIVSELYRSGMCSKTEAQRMLSFCSTSGPLFMIGAVAVGMLNIKSSGPIIAYSNYLGAVTLGLILRFYKYGEKAHVNAEHNISRALKSMVNINSKEERPFGLILSDAVKNSVNTLLLIGGLMIFFSVVIKQLMLSGIVGFLSRFLYIFLVPLGVDKQLLAPSVSGLFEITIGSSLIANSTAAITQKIIAISGIIAWSGLSIHAQVAGVLSNTDLSTGTYILCKVFHSVLTCIYAYIIISIWGIEESTAALPVFSYVGVITDAGAGWVTKLAISSIRYSCIILLIFIVSLIYSSGRKLYLRISR